MWGSPIDHKTNVADRVFNDRVNESGLGANTGQSRVLASKAASLGCEEEVLLVNGRMATNDCSLIRQAGKEVPLN